MDSTTAVCSRRWQPARGCPPTKSGRSNTTTNSSGETGYPPNQNGASAVGGGLCSARRRQRNGGGARQPGCCRPAGAGHAPIPTPQQKDSGVPLAVRPPRALESETFEEETYAMEKSTIDANALHGGLKSSVLLSAVAVILDVHCAQAPHSCKEAIPVGPLRNFYSTSPRTLTLRDYLLQLKKLLRCSRECFILALVYIDKFVERSPEVVICDLTVERLILTAICIAAKFLDDKGEDNADVAQAGGLATSELNELELLFLERLDWRAYVSDDTYEWYQQLTCMVVAGE